MSLFGGTPEQKPELYAAASPVTYIDQVTVPVFVIQGNNDSCCPPRQMRMFEAKMRELGKDIDVLWFDGGHDTNDNEEWIRRIERMLRWAYRVLGSEKLLP